jgi:hypothetical protein
MNVTLIDSVEGDPGGDKAKPSLSDRELRLRQDVRAAPRLSCAARPKSATDDPLLESWQKLLAKYRRK